MKCGEGRYFNLNTDVATMLLSLCKHLKVCSKISDPNSPFDKRGMEELGSGFGVLRAGSIGHLADKK